MNVEFQAPRTLTEEMLATIWQDVLHVDRIGVHDDFFELGGNSLLAMQVVARVREIFQLEMEIRSLFERTTIEGMAAAVAELQRDQQFLPVGLTHSVKREAERISATLDQLSDEEIDALLTEISLPTET